MGHQMDEEELDKHSCFKTHFPQELICVEFFLGILQLDSKEMIICFNFLSRTFPEAKGRTSK